MRIILLYVFCLGLILNYSYAQNKKKQIEELNFSLDSLKIVHTNTISAYIDSLNIERDQNSKQKINLYKLQAEIEILTLQSKNFQDRLNVSNLEKSEIKKELEVLKEKQENNLEGLHYYSLIVNKDDFILKSIKSKLFNYPEKSTLSEQLRYTKSFSELKECRLWKKDRISYAFVIVKDTKKVPNTHSHAGEGDFAKIGDQVTFRCYILTYIDTDFIVYMKWNNTFETCFEGVDDNSENIDFRLTDLNNDNQIEIWYVLESSCTLGVEPSRLQICLFNNGILNTMESITNYPELYTDNDVKEWIKEGSDFSINKFDANFEKLSQEFKAYAVKLRNINLYGSSHYYR
jgi:hypothetical protein